MENRKKHEWILIDDDSYQHVRKIDAETFDLIELCIIAHDPDRFEVYTDTIRLSDYPDQEITEIINGFGYSSIRQIMDEYGDEGNQVITECIFEHYGSFAVQPLVTGLSYENARDFISKYISKE